MAPQAYTGALQAVEALPSEQSTLPLLCSIAVYRPKAFRLGVTSRILAIVELEPRWLHGHPCISPRRCGKEFFPTGHVKSAETQ